MCISFSGNIVIIFGNIHTGENLLQYYSSITLLLYTLFSFKMLHCTIFITSYKLLCIVLNRIISLNQLILLYYLSNLLIIFNFCYLLHILLNVKHHTSVHMTIQRNEPHHYITYQNLCRDGL